MQKENSFLAPKNIIMEKSSNLRRHRGISMEHEMEKKGKRERVVPQLPVELIHEIQSFLPGKEVAQTSCLSKTWYHAWSTNPTPSFDEADFKDGDGFAGFSTRSMARYRVKNLRIQRFTLRTHREAGFLAMELTAAAVAVGAKDLDIELPFLNSFVLPAEVLGSVTLTRLRLRRGSIGEGDVRCSSLKSLTLYGVCLIREEESIRDIISCCSSCLEELSLSAGLAGRGELELSGMLQQFELHKLRVLYLRDANVGELFLGFQYLPCLKELTVDNCRGYSRVQIASTSLESISFVEQNKALKGEFNVPNLRKFVYGGSGLPSLSFKACSRHQLECDISIKWSPHYYTSSWFKALKNLLAKLRRASSPSPSSPSSAASSSSSASAARISLSISPCPNTNQYLNTSEMEKREIEAVPEPVVVEKLSIHASSSTYSYFFLLGFFRVCRPTFIVHAPEIGTGDDRVFGICLVKLKEKISNLNIEFYDEVRGDWQSYGYTKLLEDSFNPSSTPVVHFRCT